MKHQTWIILTLVFALIIAIFAVINVDAVEVDFLFTQADAPLILVILFSALLGCLAVASVSYSKLYHLKKENRQLKHERESFHEDPTNKTTNEATLTENQTPEETFKTDKEEHSRENEDKKEDQS